MYRMRSHAPQISMKLLTWPSSQSSENPSSTPVLRQPEQGCIKVARHPRWLVHARVERGSVGACSFAGLSLRRSAQVRWRSRSRATAISCRSGVPSAQSARTFKQRLRLSLTSWPQSLRASHQRS